MKYYKIIQNNSFIGIVHSGQFAAYNANNTRLGYADETTGQFVKYDGVFYRDYWMVPVPETAPFPFVIASVLEISEEEYNTLYEAINNNEEIIIDDDEPEEPIPEPVPSEDPDEILEFMRSSKLNQMSKDCRTAIESGFDLDLRGEAHHFSLTTQDQLNLISLGTMVDTQSLIPYHADGEECIFFTPEEIKEIIAAAASFKNYQLSYHNSLKTYINTLDTIEAIAAITYGTPIPDEYKSDVLKVLE